MRRKESGCIDGITSSLEPVIHAQSEQRAKGAAYDRQHLILRCHISSPATVHPTAMQLPLRRGTAVQTHSKRPPWGRLAETLVFGCDHEKQARVAANTVIKKIQRYLNQNPHSSKSSESRVQSSCSGRPVSRLLLAGNGRLAKDTLSQLATIRLPVRAGSRGLQHAGGKTRRVFLSSQCKQACSDGFSVPDSSGDGSIRRFEVGRRVMEPFQARIGHRTGLSCTDKSGVRIAEIPFAAGHNEHVYRAAKKVLD